jgi:hypothetical protein
MIRLMSLIAIALWSFFTSRVHADLVVPSERVVQFVDVREDPRSGSSQNREKLFVTLLKEK